MKISKYAGRSYECLGGVTRTGLVVAFLATTNAVATADNLCTDGLVRCWGYNNGGQCNVPTDLGPCLSVAGGNMHTIALRVDGTVRCWGYNSHGTCNDLLDIISKFKTYWTILSTGSKDSLWQYLHVLTQLCKKYYES